MDCNQESDSPNQELDELVDFDIQDTGSESTDDTWTLSIDGEDSDDDIGLEDNSRIWQEVPLRLEDFSISINKVDSDLEFGYKEEVKELKKCVLREFNNLSNDNVKKATLLNASQIMNAVYNAELLSSVLGFQNKSLVEKKKEPMDVNDYEVFLCVFIMLLLM